MSQGSENSTEQAKTHTASPKFIDGDYIDIVYRWGLGYWAGKAMKLTREKPPRTQGFPGGLLGGGGFLNRDLKTGRH